MNPIKNPHDRYFHAAMPEPQVVRDFFETYLPQEIKRRVDLESLQICKDPSRQRCALPQDIR